MKGLSKHCITGLDLINLLTLLLRDKRRVYHGRRYIEATFEIFLSNGMKGSVINMEVLKTLQHFPRRTTNIFNGNISGGARHMKLRLTVQR